jgi:hypothetical protein
VVIHEPKLVTARLGACNSIGKVAIMFSEPLVDLKDLNLTIQMISNSLYFEVKYNSYLDMDIASPELLSWHITYFTSLGIQFQFEFSERLLVSKGTQLDEITIEFLEPSIF